MKPERPTDIERAALCVDCPTPVCCSSFGCEDWRIKPGSRMLLQPIDDTQFDWDLGEEDQWGNQYQYRQSSPYRGE